MVWFIVAVVGASLGLVYLARLMVPARPDLAVAVGRWEQARQHASRAPLSEGVRQAEVLERLGTRVADRLARSGIQLPQVKADLAICKRSLEQHLAKTVVTAAVGLVAPSVLSLAAAAVGLPVPLPVPILLGALLAVGLVVAANSDLHKQAETHREELRRSLSMFLDVVAMALAGGRGVPEALPSAAAIGSGWTFELLEETLHRARLKGVSTWDALDELGQRFGMQELRDLSSSVRQVADDGAKIRSSLTARAATLRERRLTETEGKQQQASESMRYAQLGAVIAFLLYLIYPMLATLFTTG